MREPESIHAYLELHIEQGPILDTEKKEIGIVEGIAGGGGAGGGVKPIAVIIVDKDGARVEPIKSGMASAKKAIPTSVTSDEKIFSLAPVSSSRSKLSTRAATARSKST